MGQGNEKVTITPRPGGKDICHLLYPQSFGDGHGIFNLFGRCQLPQDVAWFLPEGQPELAGRQFSGQTEIFCQEEKTDIVMNESGLGQDLANTLRPCARWDTNNGGFHLLNRP
jgi:hypothetical protein